MPEQASFAWVPHNRTVAFRSYMWQSALTFHSSLPSLCTKMDGLPTPRQGYVLARHSHPESSAWSRSSIESMHSLDSSGKTTWLHCGAVAAFSADGAISVKFVVSKWPKTNVDATVNGATGKPPIGVSLPLLPGGTGGLKAALMPHSAQDPNGQVRRFLLSFPPRLLHSRGTWRLFLYFWMGFNTKG